MIFEITFDMVVLLSQHNPMCVQREIKYSVPLLLEILILLRTYCKISPFLKNLFNPNRNPM